MNDPTYEEAVKAVSYDPVTGVFTRNKTKKVIGKYTTTSRYRSVHINGRTYAQHRIAWLLYYKKPPEHVINHINGQPGDNRIANLEDVPPLVNTNSYKNLSKKNKSGFKNVSFNSEKGKWVASKTYYGKHYFLGMYDTPEEANNAIMNFKKLNKLPLYDNEVYAKPLQAGYKSKRSRPEILVDKLTDRLGIQQEQDTPGAVRYTLFNLIDLLINCAIPGETIDSYHSRLTKKLLESNTDGTPKTSSVTIPAS